MWRSWFTAIGLLCLGALSAWAQTPLWSGSYTPGHGVVQVAPGVLGDAGSALGSSTQNSKYLTEQGITKLGLPDCVNDALLGAPGGYHQLCLGANATVGGITGGFITYNNYGGAAPLPLYANVNGTNYQIPPSGAGAGNVVGPVSSTINNLPVFANTLGTLLGPSSFGAGVVSAAHPYTPATGSQLGTLQIGIGGITDALGVDPFISGTNGTAATIAVAAALNDSVGAGAGNYQYQNYYSYLANKGVRPSVGYWSVSNPNTNSAAKGWDYAGVLACGTPNGSDPQGMTCVGEELDLFMSIPPGPVTGGSADTLGQAYVMTLATAGDAVLGHYSNGYINIAQIPNVSTYNNGGQYGIFINDVTGNPFALSSGGTPIGTIIGIDGKTLSVGGGKVAVGIDFVGPDNPSSAQVFTGNAIQSKNFTVSGTGATFVLSLNTSGGASIGGNLGVTGTTTLGTGVFNIANVSGAGSAAKYVCADSSNNVLVQVSPC